MSEQNKEEEKSWDERYRTGELPWDTGRPDLHLVSLISKWPLVRGKALDIGCGTGTNSLWLARQGFEATGLDVSAEAIAQARQRAGAQEVDCTFVCDDFLTSDMAANSLAFAFDRGCLHTIAGEQRGGFVKKVAKLLLPGGLWLSLIGNADDPRPDKGPPKLSAAAVAQTVEPFFEILELESCLLESRLEHAPRFWRCLLRKR